VIKRKSKVREAHKSTELRRKVNQLILRDVQFCQLLQLPYLLHITPSQHHSTV